MSLCDNANCFFGVLFLIQIVLSKSEGKPCTAAPSAARDTGSYLPHSVPVFTDDATLEILLQEHLHADHGRFAVYIRMEQSILLLIFPFSELQVDW